MDEQFTIKDLEKARYFLGLEIVRSSDGLYVHQQKYVMDLIQDARLMECKPVTTPLPKVVKFSKTEGEFLEDPQPYRRLVGWLLYLGFTRPNISHATQQLSQYVQSPCTSHWEGAMYVLRYLKNTSSMGLFFPSNNTMDIIAFCDFDWGACLDTRRSLTGYCIFLGKALISWKTKKQATVSRSTAEEEYRAMVSTVCELQWVSYILKDFHVYASTPITLHCDNLAAIHIAQNPVF